MRRHRLAVRWRHARALEHATCRWPPTGGPTSSQQPDLRKLLPTRLPQDATEHLVDALAQRLVFRTLAPATRQAVLGFLGPARRPTR